MKTTIKHEEVWVRIHADKSQCTLPKYPAWPSPSSLTHSVILTCTHAFLASVSPQRRNVFAADNCCGVEIKQKFRDVTLHAITEVLRPQSWGWRSGFQLGWNWRWSGGYEMGWRFQRGWGSCLYFTIALGKWLRSRLGMVLAAERKCWNCAWSAQLPTVILELFHWWD